jgi:Ser-tRNA(Ala) deacylase AlaX
MVVQTSKLLYMEDMQALTCKAFVVDAKEIDGKVVLVLDQTLFYPQGGGQPYDKGLIKSGDNIFNVEEVRFVDGEVLHIGNFEVGLIKKGDEVECFVDAERRKLHMRLHSGGHIVDMAVFALGLKWVPGKGYHFPDGPYVEYEGDVVPENLEITKVQIENKCNEIISNDAETTIRFMPKEEMSSVCHNVPDYLPEGKPARVVLYGDFGVPCGGTHVANLSEVGKVEIRKIKNKKGTIKVSYNVV